MAQEEDEFTKEEMTQAGEKRAQFQEATSLRPRGSMGLGWEPAGGVGSAYSMPPGGIVGGGMPSPLGAGMAMHPASLAAQMQQLQLQQQYFSGGAPAAKFEKKSR